MTSCKLCGANLALVGRSHRCVSPNTATASPNTSPNRKRIGETASRLPHKQEKAGAAPASAPTTRNALWRSKNGDAYRDYMRDYMRRRREKS